MITTASIVRSTALVATGAAIAVPLAAGLGPAAPAPFLAGPAPAASGLAERTAASVDALSSGVTRTALEATGSVTRQTGTFASEVVEDAAEVAGDTATQAPAAAQDAAEESAETARDTAQTAVEVARRQLTGSVEVCPGGPVSAGVQLRRGDLLALRALRTPAATTQTVREAVEVTLPDAQALLEDPAAVQLSPGGTTGASVQAPVVDRAVAQTGARVTAPEPDRAQRAAEQDAATVRSELPRLQVQFGGSTSELTTSTWVSTAGSAGPLSFRLAGGESDACSTVSWVLTR